MLRILPGETIFWLIFLRVFLSPSGAGSALHLREVTRKFPPKVRQRLRRLQRSASPLRWAIRYRSQMSGGIYQYWTHWRRGFSRGVKEGVVRSRSAELPRCPNPTKAVKNVTGMFNPPLRSSQVGSHRHWLIWTKRHTGASSGALGNVRGPRSDTSAGTNLWQVNCMCWGLWQFGNICLDNSTRQILVATKISVTSPKFLTEDEGSSGESRLQKWQPRRHSD
jgi:hypothetical protein